MLLQFSICSYILLVAVINVTLYIDEGPFWPMYVIIEKKIIIITQVAYVMARAYS